MRKRRWNKINRYMMSAVMCLTMLADTGITAAAVEPGTDPVPTAEVEAVELTIPEELLLAGAVYTESKYTLPGSVTVNQGNCTVEGMKLQDAGGFELQENERLSGKNEYVAVVTLKADGSDTFDENATVKVNGSEEGIDVVNRYKEGEFPYCKLEFTWTFQPMVKEYINVFDFSNLPAAVPGTKQESYTYTYTMDGEEKYTVTGNWHQYNASSQQYEPMADEEEFMDDGAYQLVLHADMKPGYVIPEDAPLEVTAEGEWMAIEYSDEFGWKCSIYTSFGTEIHEVSITVPEPVDGEAFSDAAPITAEVPSGSNYTVKGNWVDEETSSCTGTFTKGKSYYFAYTVYAGDGYYLAEDVGMYINGTLEGYLSGNGKTGSGMYRRSLKNVITEVILTDVPKAEIGKPLQTEEFTITVPDGAVYKAMGQWYGSDGNPITNGLAEAGKEYDLFINLQADPGYEFAKQCILKINGAAHMGEGGTEFITYRMRYAFFEQIRQIEVTGVIAPVAGQAPDMTSLMSADPAKYEITHMQWLDLETGLLVTEFEDGHTYHLIVEVEAKPGYEFVPNVSWKLGENSSKGEPYVSARCQLWAEYSFAEVVPELRIDHIPGVKVGEMPQTDIPVPADAKYTAHAEWRVWDARTEMWQPFSGAFEKGKSYILAITAEPKAGYRFDPDVTACYLNGVLNKEFRINTLDAWVDIEYAEEGAELIHKVEVYVSKPAVGDHSDVDSVFTLPDGVHYQMCRGQMWIEGSIEENNPFVNRYFEEDGSYGIRFRLIADEGYAFAEDLAVVVNGIVLPAEAFISGAKTVDADYFFDMTCQHIYDNEADSTCNVCGYQRYEDTGSKGEAGDADFKDDANQACPRTGEQSELLIWLSVLVVSGMTIIGMGRRKRMTR